MEFLKGFEEDTGCKAFDECPRGFLRCCVRCPLPCKKCIFAKVWKRQSESWKHRDCSQLVPAVELAWIGIFKEGKKP